MYESWKPVVGYEGLYEVSSLGRVKRVARRYVDSRGQNKAVSEMIMKEGELHEVILCKNGKYQNRMIRALVAEAFLGIPYGEAISHIDRDTSNACVNNLVRTSDFRKMDPNWRDIPGWEGEYQASRFGEIRSVDRYTKAKNETLRYCPGVVRTPEESDDGYYQIALYRDGKSVITTNAHIFVAKAWISNPENKPTVNHIDGNKKNNCVENLEWATYAEQQEHAKRTGLRKKPWWSLEQNGPVGGDWNDRRQIAVRCIETGQTYDSFSSAARALSTGASEIKSAVDNKKVCRGLHFVKAEDPDYQFGIINLEGEEWRDIPGYENLYQISSLGRIKSMARAARCAKGTRTVPEKLLNTSRGTVSLNKDNAATSREVRDLLLEVFGESCKHIIRPSVRQKKLFDI